MKKLLMFSMLFLPAISHAGTITTSFLNSAGSITISSNTTVSSPLTFVQAVSTATTDGGCGSTTTPMTVAAGDLLVLGCVTTSNLSGITPSDGTNTWLVANSTTNLAGTAFVGIWYVKSAAAGSTTVTAFTNGCDGLNWCVLAEYSGQNTSSPYDVFMGSAPTATGLPVTTLSTTTVSNNELMFSVFYDASGTLPITSQSGTPRFATVGNPRINAQDANVATPQAYTSTWTETIPFSWVAAEAAFKPR
jgi:hypothetical protein